MTIWSSYPESPIIFAFFRRIFRQITAAASILKKRFLKFITRLLSIVDNHNEMSEKTFYCYFPSLKITYQ